jgi:hypothetical protein
LIEEVPPEWGYGPVKKEKRRPHDLIDALALLRRCMWSNLLVLKMTRNSIMSIN